MVTAPFSLSDVPNVLKRLSTLARQQHRKKATLNHFKAKYAPQSHFPTEGNKTCSTRSCMPSCTVCPPPLLFSTQPPLLLPISLLFSLLFLLLLHYNLIPHIVLPVPARHLKPSRQKARYKDNPRLSIVRT